MMKTFTFNDIKEFCKTHYGEYMGESETAITFTFIGQDTVRKVGFLDLALTEVTGLNDRWIYVDYSMFGKDKYMFNFKRIA